VGKASRSGQQDERAAKTQASYDVVGAPLGASTPGISLDEVSQITARLRLTPPSAYAISRT